MNARYLITAGALAVSTFAPAVEGQRPSADWPQYRGPSRDGSAGSFTAPRTWPEQLVRRWRVEAEWWKGGPARDYLTLRTADGMICEVYIDRGTGASWLQRVMD